MTILIIGASGFVGNSLFQLLKDKDTIGTYYSTFKTGLLKLNMTSRQDLEFIFYKYKPDSTFMPAFIPGVDYCELHKEACETNKLGVKSIVDMCSKYDSKMIFFSSDYIFDGKCGPYTENDIPNPINEYGKTKLNCEKMVQKLNNYLIIRTTVVYGYNINSKNFLMTLISDLSEEKERKVPLDQLGSPTFVEDLSKISIDLLKRDKNGIYNVVGPDYCSRYTFALQIARTFNLNEELLIPVKTDDLNQQAKRPLKAGLIIDKVRNELNSKPLGVSKALRTIKKLYFDSN